MDALVKPIIREEHATTPDVAALLAYHVATMQAGSPEESCHVMSGDALSEAGVTLLTLRDGAGRLLGIGALKEISIGTATRHGEIKSMHTAAQARGRGVGATILRALIDVARQAGLAQISLETGSGEAFVSARKLYLTHGFDFCAPFGSYSSDPLSVFMTRATRSEDGDVT